MPAFQRQFVWNMKQIEKLWDSILLNYPIRLGCNPKNFENYDLIENETLKKAVYENAELLFS
jgi:uncharacterized protein with ParB-like and HNH nuclease domain